MKSLSSIIKEKLIINKNIKTHNDYISYNEFKEDIKNTFDISDTVFDQCIYNGLCLSPIESVEKHTFRLLNREYDKSDDSLFNLVDDLTNDTLDKKIMKTYFRHLYTSIPNNIKVFFHKTTVLVGDGEDKYFFIFIDSKDKKSYIYQVK